MRDLQEIKKANEEFEAREKAGAFDLEAENRCKDCDELVEDCTCRCIRGDREDVSGFPNVDRTDQVGQ